MKRSNFMGLILILMTTACGSSSTDTTKGGEGQECHPNEVCDEHLLCQDGLCVMPTADAANSTDMFGSCGSEEGCFGTPCQDSEQCDSGHCTLHLGDYLCSMTCTDECPGGWTCYTDEDTQNSYCVSNAPNICQPCSTDEACDAPGIVGHCVNYGDDGRFCSTECALDDECPQGYICDVLPNEAANDTKYCISETGACSCSQSSIEEEHQTPCFISNEYGSCEGSRSCSTHGLTDCDAAIPSEDICDEIDNDCDGETDNGTGDEASVDAPTWFKDSDGDGYGDPAESIRACARPEGYEDNSLDCDDQNELIHPDGIEICDNKDNNCDGESDEATATDAGTWYEDKDGDGHGNAGVSLISCNAPDGYVALSDDCYDGDASIYPNATEYCDGMDNNCNEEIDEGDAAPQTYYADFDSDNYGNSEVTSTGCGAPPNYVLQMGDCNDFDAQINPEGIEVCDGIDNDCNDAVDEGDAAPNTYYADFDGDGFGSNTITQSACAAPPNYIAVSGDCNDFDAGVNPDGTEVCDGIDNNCDDAIDDGDASPSLWYPDFDGDGHGSTFISTTACTAPSNYTATSGDCDDYDPFLNPEAAEICDGVDNNCSDETDENLGSTTCGLGICEHTVANCLEGQNQSCDPLEGVGVEVCDGLDNDCDGVEDESTCDDSVACTIDACDAVTGCSQTPDDTPCQAMLDPADSLCKLAICDTVEGCKVITEISCCGNGLVEDGEACDDGNAETSDGCSAGCAVENNALCSGEPSVCDIDADPDPFSFPETAGVEINASTQSDEIVLSGFYGTVEVTVSSSGGAPTIVKNGVNTGLTSIDMVSGDALSIQMLSAPTFSTTHAATIDIGAFSTSWNLVTRPECVGGTMDYSTAGLYSFTMPVGCEQISVKAWGAAGGGASGGKGGGGGYVRASLNIGSGEEIQILVGSGGNGPTTLQFGDGGIGYSHGGGRSSIKVGGTETLIAGGGGGGQEGNQGAAGGGLNGGNASGSGGSGGTQTAGGNPGAGSDGVGVGVYLKGGRGSSASCPACGSSSNIWSPGGGGGYYGGGGGGGHPFGGGGWMGYGGGGGSSLVPPGGETLAGSAASPGNPGEAGGAGTGTGTVGADGRVILTW